MPISSARIYSTELKSNIIRLTLVCLLNPCLGFAEVYRWVDERGRVHFGDKPPSEDAEMIPVERAPPRDNALNERRKKQQRLLEVYSEERAEAREIKAKERAAQQRRKANCERARAYLSGAQNARFLFEQTDDPDNPHVYSDAERQKAEAKAQADVEHWCHAL